MQKALTKEDLMYILDAIFKISSQQNNGVKILEDGLYAEDYHNDFNTHQNDSNLHINQNIKTVLDGFTVDENGNLLYNNFPVNISISSKEGNAIQIINDGIFVTDVSDHVSNDDIHTTKEDKEAWSKSLQDSKDYTNNEIDKLVIYDTQIVTSLPETDILDTRIYMLENDPNCPSECLYTLHMNIKDQWFKLGITNETLNTFALKVDVENTYLKIDDSHEHSNKETIDRFSVDENDNLLFDEKDIRHTNVSENQNNAIQVIDGKIFVEDKSNEIKSLQISAAFSKVNLYNEEITDSGMYQLKDVIDNYNLLLIEYYYRPNDPNEAPGCAKTAVIDTDVINELYIKNLDYMLEYGYGVLTSNSKIKMNHDKIWVNYYHNVCIYKITGIRKGDENG